MKALMTLLALGLVLGGCTGNSSGEMTRSDLKQGRLIGLEKAGKLEREAVDAAVAELNRCTVTVDDRTYADFTMNGLMLVLQEGAFRCLKEMKGLRYNIERFASTEADRMNGVEWRGTIYFWCPACRDLPVAGEGVINWLVDVSRNSGESAVWPRMHQGAWSDWYDWSADAMLCVDVEIRDGKIAAEAREKFGITNGGIDALVWSLAKPSPELLRKGGVKVPNDANR